LDELDGGGDIENIYLDHITKNIETFPLGHVMKRICNPIVQASKADFCGLVGQSRSERESCFSAMI
jgi:hypothetical protein